MNKVLIVQPWFSAVGHPAQSLLNTARILGKQAEFIYIVSIEPATTGIVVSVEPGATGIEASLAKLAEYARVITFTVASASLREGTFKAIQQLRCLFRNEKMKGSILFFDAHLVLLSALWGSWTHIPEVSRLGVIYLIGPERIKSSRLASWLVKRFISRPEVVLYLRTEELVSAWHEAFPSVNAAHIRHMPSLEIPEDGLTFPEPVKTTLLKFGIVGQIRRGKGLEYLVPLFQRHPHLGKLTVAGTFNNPAERAALPELADFPGFIDIFLSENDLLQQVANQDYLLMLYSNWDERMESAVLYLAARANRPVITYNKGWCGRLVAQFNCGLFAPPERSALKEFLSMLPKPGEAEYQQLLAGIQQFRINYSGGHAKSAFLKALLE